MYIDWYAKYPCARSRVCHCPGVQGVHISNELSPPPPPPPPQLKGVEMKHNIIWLIWSSFCTSWSSFSMLDAVQHGCSYYNNTSRWKLRVLGKDWISWVMLSTYTKFGDDSFRMGSVMLHEQHLLCDLANLCAADGRTCGGKTCGTCQAAVRGETSAAPESNQLASYTSLINWRPTR